LSSAASGHYEMADGWARGCDDNRSGRDGARAYGIVQARPVVQGAWLEVRSPSPTSPFSWCRGERRLMTLRPHRALGAPESYRWWQPHIDFAWRFLPSTHGTHSVAWTTQDLVLAEVGGTMTLATVAWAVLDDSLTSSHRNQEHRLATIVHVCSWMTPVGAGVQPWSTTPRTDVKHTSRLRGVHNRNIRTSGKDFDSNSSYTSDSEEDTPGSYSRHHASSFSIDRAPAQVYIPQAKQPLPHSRGLW
jgi:hypothetical protein